jgi:hypothetical protein
MDAKKEDVLDVNIEKCTNSCLASRMYHRHNLYSNRVRREKNVPIYSHISLPHYFIRVTKNRIH